MGDTVSGRELTPGHVGRMVRGVEGDDLSSPLQGLGQCGDDRVQLPEESLV